MKKLFTILTAVLLTTTLWAQSPEKMSYQAVIRDASNNLVANQQIGMQISILQGSTFGASIYVETQATTTNVNGLVSIEIGGENSTVLNGNFSTIDWVNGPYYLKTETDPAGGTNYTITGISQLLSVPYALHAETAETISGGIIETDPTVPTYSVGDFAQGGIVFWVDETGQHGLVAAKDDQSTGVRWYAGTFGDTQAKGDGPFAGEANTSIIIAAQVAIGDDENTYAARICNELQITEGGITYGDWYLPSKEELNLMYVNKATIDATAGANGGSAFATGLYWSSTESNSNGAWGQVFDDGSLTNYGKVKSSTYYVRAVRAY